MMSLNRRVLLSASLVLLIFIAGITFTLDRAFYDSARIGVEDHLFAKLLMLMGDTEVEDSGKLNVLSNQLDVEFELVNSHTYAFITDSTHTIIWCTASSLNKPIPTIIPLGQGEKIFEQILLNNKPYFIYRYSIVWETPTGDYPLTFHVITNTTLLDAQIERYRKDLWGWLSVLAILLLVAQLLVLRWGLLPLRKVSVELAAIESGHQESLKERYPKELKLLTDSINSLITHEHKQQKRYRNGLADLAHSLKTPLAILQGAIRSSKDGEAIAHHQTIQEQIERMDNVIQYQLRRAATAGSSPGMGLISLSSMMNRIVHTVTKAHQHKHPVITIAIDNNIYLRMDEGDLMELLGNLIDNAFKWCQNSVQLAAHYRGNQVEIQIGDDGPGIPAQEITQMMERGARADQSTSGHGIGLAIVRDIMQVYEGELLLENHVDGGLCVTLRFDKKR